ncbi:MAG: tetratricopeptide repeat protein [Myxococcales bacterium]|jgi:tetratricopeptide (TPR) repeat protein
MGDIERLVAAADDGTVDDEFLKHLSRGGELLSAGQIHEAKEALEKAFNLQPKNQKAQNLLGLTYFKLGSFDRAAEIYELLVRDNPVDPTLRVNLGLVYLKANALERATREFETAVDLAPDHKKAQNYLGLAYAQAGDYARAKDCFVAAGSLTMAERMERALKDPTKAPRVGGGEDGAAPPAKSSLSEKIRAAKQTGEIEVEIEVDAGDEQPETPVNAWDIEASGEASAPVQPAPEPQPAAATAAEVAAAPPAAALEPAPEASAWQGQQGVGGYATASLEQMSAVTAVAPRESVSVFEVGDLVYVRVAGEILTRLEGLLAALGSLQYVPEMKRFRGRATDKVFGDGERRMVRVSGNGQLVLDLKGRNFVVIDLVDESAYFREDLVFAFEETVVFENGRVPSKVAPDLHLVHLRGSGKVLLCVPGALRTVGIAGAPCTVPMNALVGWHGLLTPRIVALPDEQTPVIPVVELTGEGYAILTGFKPAC